MSIVVCLKSNISLKKSGVGNNIICLQEKDSKVELIQNKNKSKIMVPSSASFSRIYTGFNLEKYFIGCLVIWVIASVWITSFNIPQNYNTNTTKQEYSDLIPEIVYSNNPKKNIAPIPEVKGVSEKANPYQNYEYLSRFYELEPEMTEQVLQKIRDYIEKYRSYEGLNNRFQSPVPAEVYLETSLKYQVPLSSVLAVARLESRFGTDCYDDVQATRICKHKNVYSYGLDDSGNNLTFDSWNGGVYAFGSWYERMKQNGLSDCQMWRRYNPNGDYCARVNKVKNEVVLFFKSD